MAITLQDCDRNIAEYYEWYRGANNFGDKMLFMEGVDEWLDMRLFIMKKERRRIEREEVSDGSKIHA